MICRLFSWPVESIVGNEGGTYVTRTVNINHSGLRRVIQEQSWIDMIDNPCDTRHRVMKSDYIEVSSCAVYAGRSLSPYAQAIVSSAGINLDQTA